MPNNFLRDFQLFEIPNRSGYQLLALCIVALCFLLFTHLIYIFNELAFSYDISTFLQLCSSFSSDLYFN